MPTADIEGAKTCMVEAEYKQTRGTVREVKMDTNTLVVSPSCAPFRWLQIGVDLEAGRFTTDSGGNQNFFGNPRVRAKVNLLSWKQGGGWEKLTAEVRVPINAGQSFSYFLGPGVWQLYNYQLQERTTGFGPQGSLYFGIDRANWIATFGGHYLPAWSKNGITTPMEAGGTLTLERVLYRFENQSEISMVVGANDHNIWKAKVNGQTIGTTGGKELMAQVGVQVAIGEHNVLEAVYEKAVIEHLRPDQVPTSNTFRFGYRWRW